MTKVGVVALLLTTFLVTSCCSSKPSISDFRALSLEQKIEEAEKAYRAGCLREVENVYLGMIADHGIAAADAMTTLIGTPRSDFPVRSAITVAGFINANRIELRGHPLYLELKRVATTSSNREERILAEKVLTEIDTKQIVR